PEKIENKKREKKSQNERVKFGFGIGIKDQSSGGGPFFWGQLFLTNKVFFLTAIIHPVRVDETGQEEDEVRSDINGLNVDERYPRDEALQKNKAGSSFSQASSLT
ncbi:hypothetical protein WG66_017147, partial [Moniliophthora roreri]